MVWLKWQTQKQYARFQMTALDDNATGVHRRNDFKYVGVKPPFWIHFTFEKKNAGLSPVWLPYDHGDLFSPFLALSSAQFKSLSGNI